MQAYLYDLLLLLRALALEHDALQLFKDGELFVGVVNLCVSLFLGDQKADFLEPLELTLDIASVFFDELSEPAYVGLKIGVLGIDHNDLSPDS